MGRKNRRKKSHYERKMKVDPKKLLSRATIAVHDGYSIGSVSESDAGYDTGYHTDHHMDHHTDHHTEKAKETGATETLIQHPHRGDIWFVELGFHPGTSVQEGCRPAVIISNDMANEHSGTVTIVPMTSKMKKPYLPTHVTLRTGDVKLEQGQYMEQSMLLAEQVTTIGKSALKHYVGVVTEQESQEIERAVETHLGLACPAR